MPTATASPVDYPHLREAPTTTLKQLADSLDSTIVSIEVESGSDIKISPDLTTIKVKKQEVPVTEESLDALANWVDFPKAFLHRLDTDLQGAWLNTILDRKRDKAIVRVGERSGLVSVLKPGQVPFDQSMVVRTAAKVLGNDGAVISTGQSATTFHLDAAVNLKVGKGDLGDPKVGDITKAGLRFDMNIAQNLAPTVQPWWYRLWCTNGCGTEDAGLKLDARGLDVEEVLAELEAKARLAFSMVDAKVQAMYDLRNEAVPHPERTINRLAREQRLPDRVRLHMIDALPSLVPDMGSVSMFDIVNVATHLANSPDITSRGSRLTLEHFGGEMVASHVERCGACQAKLN